MSDAVETFIAKWLNTPGGAERANYQVFLTEFAQALGLPTADPAVGGVLGDYQFDAPVPGGSLNGGQGFADMYRKGSFLLEAKQSHIPADKQQHPELFDPVESAPQGPSGARYDKLMRDALRQAKQYVVNLPASHPWPPFIIVADVGRAFELYFDWAGNGRGYDFFPDRQSYRVTLDQLADAEVQALFRDIWLDPKARDPRLKAAEVTRDVARALAYVSQGLEQTQRIKLASATDYERSLAVEETSLFLMRLLFCMFAEDVDLLPKDSFRNFLAEAVKDERLFAAGLMDLWQKMGRADIEPRYSWVVKDEVRYFNGGLFAETKTYPIGAMTINVILDAAKAEWSRVEPAIFGTLLEQALTPTERAKLGAHYTPRPFVERVVRATIMDVLDGEWQAAQATAETAAGEGRTQDAIDALTAFHGRLSALRILDPACGTGNFLYVAMELLLRLEADVLDMIERLGGTATATVGPQQFYGLELNARAAVIAELVLWIGWLRWRVRNDPASIVDPVLRRTETINFGGHAGYDAVLCRTATGEPDTDHPMIPDWPEADFIIGNPPFIGGKDIRDKLGSDYAEALWKANPRVPKSADFVMQWWDRAAYQLTRPNSPLRRFGFVTTNSITQEFSRRVIANYLGEGGLSLILACPDHPWTKASRDAAAVRIAMTVAEAGDKEGQLVEVLRETGLDSDSPVIETVATQSVIHADLSTGADAGSALALLSNEGISSRGVSLHGAGFILTPSQAAHLGLGKREGLEAHIYPYRNGRDMSQSSRGVLVIDLFGLDERAVREKFPEIYQHLLETVKPERDKNRRATRRDNWWLFGELAPAFREYSKDLPRYIATVETAKHRIFQFVDRAIMPDNKLILFGLSDGYSLGVLQSNIHVDWSVRAGGWLGMGNDPVYVKSKVFDPFPFPDATPEQRATIAELAEELDAARKAAMAETSGLTMTEIYNLRDKLRTGATMDLVEQDRARAARAGIVNRLHEQIDAAVAAAYGWPADLAPSEIVTRLVALNAERAAEEKAGHVRWLRPDYQIPRFGAA